MGLRLCDGLQPAKGRRIAAGELFEQMVPFVAELPCRDRDGGGLPAAPDLCRVEAVAAAEGLVQDSCQVGPDRGLRFGLVAKPGELRVMAVPAGHPAKDC